MVTLDDLIYTLAVVIKAVYADPEPQNGELTQLFFEKKAVAMLAQQPEKVTDMLLAYWKLNDLVKGL